MPLTQQQEQVLTALQQSFAAAVSATGLKPRELCQRLLSGSVAILGPIDLASCKVENYPVPGVKSDRVQVTFATPIPNVPASLGLFHWRSGFNVVIVEQGSWVGVQAYFNEWQGFVQACVQHINATRVQDANF